MSQKPEVVTLIKGDRTYKTARKDTISDMQADGWKIQPEPPQSKEAAAPRNKAAGGAKK